MSEFNDFVKSAYFWRVSELIKTGRRRETSDMKRSKVGERYGS